MPCVRHKATTARHFYSQASQPLAVENQRQPAATARSFQTHFRNSANARVRHPSRSDLEEHGATCYAGPAQPPAPQHHRTLYANQGEKFRQTRSPANTAQTATGRIKTRTGTANARPGKEPGAHYAWSRWAAVRRCKQTRPGWLKYA